MPLFLPCFRPPNTIPVMQLRTMSFGRMCVHCPTGIQHSRARALHVPAHALPQGTDTAARASSSHAPASHKASIKFFPYISVIHQRCPTQQQYHTRMQRSCAPINLRTPKSHGCSRA